GARQNDAFDAAAANDAISTATAMNLDSSGKAAASADLTTMGDVDYYQFTAPTSFDGTFTASVDARGVSLLAPKISVYDSTGTLIATVSSDYGTVATVNLTGLTAGQTYTIVADGATSDAFGMGAYHLNVQFGGVTGAPTPPPTDPTPPPSDPTPPP